MGDAARQSGIPDEMDDGIFRWSWKIARERVSNTLIFGFLLVTFLGVAAGVFVVLPPDPTISDRLTQGAIHLAFIVGGTMLLAFSWTLARAPVLQRNALRARVRSIESARAASNLDVEFRGKAGLIAVPVVAIVVNRGDTDTFRVAFRYEAPGSPVVDLMWILPHNGDRVIRRQLENGGHGSVELGVLPLPHDDQSEQSFSLVFLSETRPALTKKYVARGRGGIAIQIRAAHDPWTPVDTSWIDEAHRVIQETDAALDELAAWDDPNPNAAADFLTRLYERFRGGQVANPSRVSGLARLAREVSTRRMDIGQSITSAAAVVLAIREDVTSDLEAFVPDSSWPDR